MKRLLVNLIILLFSITTYACEVRVFAGHIDNETLDGEVTLVWKSGYTGMDTVVTVDTYNEEGYYLEMAGTDLLVMYDSKGQNAVGEVVQLEFEEFAYLFSWTYDGANEGIVYEFGTAQAVDPTYTIPNQSFCDDPAIIELWHCDDGNPATNLDVFMSGVCMGAVLPIEISNITVRKDNDYNRVNVTTESIVDSQEMQLLKLRNGRWEIINIWDTSIDSYKSKIFTYLDKPENEVDYYRVKSVDKDGKTQLTNIITINNKFDNGVIILTKDFYSTPVNFSKA